MTVLGGWDSGVCGGEAIVEVEVFGLGEVAFDYYQVEVLMEDAADGCVECTGGENHVAVAPRGHVDEVDVREVDATEGVGISDCVEV